ncbi:hypothetical protein BJX70DRAFT_365139 [Aspergillus crustosus]
MITLSSGHCLLFYNAWTMRSLVIYFQVVGFWTPSTIQRQQLSYMLYRSESLITIAYTVLL